MMPKPKICLDDDKKHVRMTVGRSDGRSGGGQKPYKSLFLLSHLNSTVSIYPQRVSTRRGFWIFDFFVILIF